jgi:uncharacterized tellurite resistance protein B-like protein
MARVIHGESPQSLARLSRDQRLTLLKFACAAVWADLEVSESERSFIQSLALRLGLPDDDVGHVRDWLETPPTPEEVDPSLILPEHRKLFLEAVREAIAADHVVDGPEIESLRLLEELLG